MGNNLQMKSVGKSSPGAAPHFKKATCGPKTGSGPAGQIAVPDAATSSALFLDMAAISVQPKLEIGAPDDEYEREADRVADQVMRMPDPSIRMKPS
jgi:hypothetical protein